MRARARRAPSPRRRAGHRAGDRLGTPAHLQLGARLAGASHHEDWRYVDIRDKTGRAYWLVSLSGLHLFPTVLVYLGCLPLFAALTSARPLGPLDALARRGDARRDRRSRPSPTSSSARFRERRAPPGRDHGRGPLGAARATRTTSARSASGGGSSSSRSRPSPAPGGPAPGPLGITAMFAFASVPMLDRRSVRAPARVRRAHEAGAGAVAVVSAAVERRAVLFQLPPWRDRARGRRMLRPGTAILALLALSTLGRLPSFRPLPASSSAGGVGVTRLEEALGRPDGAGRRLESARSRSCARCAMGSSEIQGLALPSKAPARRCATAPR